MRALVTQRVKPERAYFLVGLPKSSWHYRPKLRQDDEIRRRIRELAGQHPRRGSRFIHVLLVKEGNKVNRKKVRRIWREEQLTIKTKPSRKIRTGKTIPMTAEFPNQVWTYDFIFDQTLGGTPLKS
ncbi:IS3 family transposase [Deinococcus oregonensis]|uniref:IS3 family transposase n=1 Tax=Deinococcus oregonensis TaxID=1805970 RepID=A0ABV6AST8_9DEIO